MVEWQEFFYKKKKIKLNKGEYNIFRKQIHSSKYRQEIEERISSSREKERLRSYFSKEELTNHTKFLDALEREFSKRNDKGADVGKSLRNRPELMFKVLKLGDQFIEEVWNFRQKKQKWSVSVKRDNLGRFQKVTRIKQLLVEENPEGRMSYSDGGRERGEESESSTYSV